MLIGYEPGLIALSITTPIPETIPLIFSRIVKPSRSNITNNIHQFHLKARLPRHQFGILRTLEHHELHRMEDKHEDHARYNECVGNHHGRRKDANRNLSGPLDESEKRRNGCLQHSTCHRFLQRTKKGSCRPHSLLRYHNNPVATPSSPEPSRDVDNAECNGRVRQGSR